MPKSTGQVEQEGRDRGDGSGDDRPGDRQRRLGKDGAQQGRLEPSRQEVVPILAIDALAERALGVACDDSTEDCRQHEALAVAVARLAP